MFHRFNTRLSMAAFVAAASLGAAIAHAQSDFGPWEWVTPSPQGNNLDGVHLLDANTAFAVGRAGTITRTTDGGATWTQIPNPVTDGFDAMGGDTLHAGIEAFHAGIHFFDADTAITAGTGPTILRSTDGGLTWVEQPHPTLDGGIIFGMSFVGNTGYLVGSEGDGCGCPLLLKTTDGGLTWEDLLADAATPLDRCNMLSAGSAPLCSPHGAFFVDADTGYIWSALAGFTGVKIRRTDDGGQTWVERDLPDSRFVIRSMHFFDADRGLVAGQVNGLNFVWRTTDGGVNWTQIFLQPLGGGGAGMHFIDDNTGWVTVWDGIARTSDGGLNWTISETNLPVEMGVADVHFADANHGLAVGPVGVILRSDDGGVTWTPQSSGHEIRHLRAVDFAPGGTPDGSTGLAVGQVSDCSACPDDGPVILRSTDSGDSWTALDTNLTTNDTHLADVVVFDAQTAVAVGGLAVLQNDVNLSHGLIVRTTDGGLNWTVQATLPGDSQLRGVSFVDANNGWAVGRGNLIVHTTDGGVTWTTQHSGDDLFLLSVSFADAMHGCAVGLAGNILSTSDGGETWTETAMPPPPGGGQAILRDVTFVDAQTGWAVGDAGILHTNDGAATWTWQAWPQGGDTNFWLMAEIECADANRCTAVSKTGRIYRTEDGGETWIVESRRVPNFSSLGIEVGLSMIDFDTGVVVGGERGGYLNQTHGYILKRSGDGGACSPADLVAPLGAINVFDLLAYLDLWFADDAAADIDGAAGIDVFDLLTYLDAWFAGCD